MLRKRELAGMAVRATVLWGLVGCGGGSKAPEQVELRAEPDSAIASCQCGDQICEPMCGEEIYTCPYDCRVCGDGICSASEGPVACAIDCCGGCGDGQCRGFNCGEDPTGCPSDCGQPCGNQICDPGENPFSCQSDCQHQVCGNGVCEPNDGGTSECAQDCGPTCGNCTCEKGEDWLACPVDCGYCGDGVCSSCALLNEDLDTCAMDCDLPSCTPDCSGSECGDDGCSGSCGTCAAGFLCAGGGNCVDSCDYKECGDNGNGVSCGECAQFANSFCGDDGICQCTSLCEGKECGTDGCDGLCGSCDSGGMCVAGQCSSTAPSYAGVFDVVSKFDMIGALPEELEVLVNIVMGFFNGPTADLMVLTCALKEQASELDDLCEFLFNNPGDPQIDDLTTIGNIAQGVIDANLLALLKDNAGEEILFTGKDVGNLLRDIEIHSTIKIKQEPDATGHIPKEATEEEWHTVSFRWTLGEDCSPLDPDCGLKSFSFNAIGQDVVVSEFDARIGLNMEEFVSQSVFNKLVIYKHPLNFKYGAFLNFIVEKFVLPMVAGDGSDGMPVIDSYEKFFMSMVGGKACIQSNNCCAVFAESIAAQVGDGVKEMFQLGCDKLVPAGADYLRKLLLDLDADTDDTFTLSTKGEDGDQGASPEMAVPCTLYDSNSNQEIDSWGKKEPQEMHCLWDVKLQLGGMDVYFESDFFGGDPSN